MERRRLQRREKITHAHTNETNRPPYACRKNMQTVLVKRHIFFLLSLFASPSAFVLLSIFSSRFFIRSFHSGPIQRVYRALICVLRPSSIIELHLLERMPAISKWLDAFITQSNWFQNNTEKKKRFSFQWSPEIFVMLRLF